MSVHGATMDPGIEPSELARRLKDPADRVLVLDVREPFERRYASIKPSIHIPMAEIPGRLDEIPRDRDLVVYCHIGERSSLVVGYLRRLGFLSVANLNGGIDAWSAYVDPKVRRY